MKFRLAYWLTMYFLMWYMQFFPITLFGMGYFCLCEYDPAKSSNEVLSANGTILTLKVVNFWKFTSYCSLKPLWSGMGK